MIGGVAHRFVGLAAAAFAAIALAGCVTPYRPAAPEPHYKVGQPYKVNGRWYYPREDPNYEAVGMASWYGREFHGRRTANGEIFDMNRLSAAHTTLPLPSLVEVKNLRNGRRVIVRVNDRGPFVKDRIIDMSQAAARKLDFEKDGVARVRVRYLGRARLADAAPKGQGAARATGLSPVLAGLATEAAGGDASADAISRIIIASAAEELTAGAQTFALAEAEAEILSDEPPPLEDLTDSPAILPAAAAETMGAPVAEPVEDANAQILADKAPAADIGPSKVAGLAGPQDDAAQEALYAVQVAVFSNLNNLEATKLALNGLGVLRIARLERAEGPLYRVRLGPFRDRETAAKRLAAVREAGYGDAQIITIAP